MKFGKVKTPVTSKGTIQAAFQQQLQEKEIFQKEGDVEKPKLENGVYFSELDSHLKNVLQVLLDSTISPTKNQREQQHAACSDFLYAVRAISFTTDCTLPTKPIYELILNEIQESDCVSTTIHAASVLHQLEKCFPYTHFKQAGAPGETHNRILQVADQVWTPMDRYETTRGKFVSHLKPKLSGDVDYGNLAYVVERLADILDPPKKKKHMDCESGGNTEIEEMGLSVMFFHLTKIFLTDFNNRLQVYQDRSDVQQLRKSLLNRFLETHSKITRSHLWEQLLRIISVSTNTGPNLVDSDISRINTGKNHVEKNSEKASGDSGSQSMDSSGWNRKRVRKEAPLAEEKVTGPSRSRRKKMENGEDKHSEIQKGGGDLGQDVGLSDNDRGSGYENYFYSPSQFCKLAHSFISMALELYELLDIVKASSRFGSERLDLMERLLCSWNELETEEKCNFISSMVRPKQKMDFLFFLFQRTVFKASLDVVNSKSKHSSREENLSTLLTWIGQLGDSTTMKRTNKLDQRSFAVILLHSLEAHLRLCVEGRFQGKTVKLSSEDLQTLVVAASYTIREVYVGELSPSTEKTLRAAEALARVANQV